MQEVPSNPLNPLTVTRLYAYSNPLNPLSEIR